MWPCSPLSIGRFCPSAHCVIGLEARQQLIEAIKTCHGWVSNAHARESYAAALSIQRRSEGHPGSEARGTSSRVPSSASSSLILFEPAAGWYRRGVEPPRPSPSFEAGRPGGASSVGGAMAGAAWPAAAGGAVEWHRRARFWSSAISLCTWATSPSLAAISDASSASNASSLATSERDTRTRLTA